MLDHHRGAALQRHHAVCAHVAGVVVTDMHPGLHPRVHHKRVAFQVAMAGIDHFAGKRRHDGGQHDAGQVVRCVPGVLQQPQELQTVFVWHPVVDCRKPPS
jgi:hypothetical protein